MNESKSRSKNDEKTSSILESSSRDLSKVVSDSSKELTDFDIPTAAELDKINELPSKLNNEKGKEEEDVPQDFFDDFLNQDFMAGLDVVDAWDADEDDESNHAKNDLDKRKDGKKEQEKDENLKEDAKETKGNKDKKYEGNLKRRDPDKTKRDIQRDKDKCAKDREVKLIKEKLKVVETGLVPPGMEMEVDLNEIQKQNVKNDKVNVESTAAVKRKMKSGEKKPSKSPIRERHYRLPDRRNSHSKSKDRLVLKNRSRSRSARRQLKERKRRSLSRTRRFEASERLSRRNQFSPPREKERKEKSPEYSKREWRYFANAPPELKIRRLRDSSNESDQSDRERWLCNRNRSRERSPRGKNKSGLRRSTSRDRNFPKRIKKTSSKSPSKRCKTFLEELDAKLAKDQYFKEVHQKLNAPAITINPMLQQQTNVVQPAPFVPHGMMYHHQQAVAPYYDEKFFIGQTVINPYSFQTNEFDQFPKIQPPLPSPAPIPPVPPVITTEKDSLKQLFTDKKISLSDYLHITARSSGDTNPINIQNKIKVISRCQDAIKELSGELKKDFVFVKSYRVIERTSDVKYQSPLKKQPLVRFNFTTPQKPTEETLFIKSIQKLIGLLRISNDFNGLNVTQALPCNPNEILSNNNKCQMNNTIVKKVSVSSQTNTFHCVDCDKRSARIFVDQGTQTFTNMSFNVATQVISEELGKESTMHHMDHLRNKSLAYLTPAELLGQAKMRTDRSPMKPSLMKQSSMQQSSMHQSSMQQSSMHQSSMQQSSMKHSSMNQTSMNQGPMKQPLLDYKKYDCEMNMNRNMSDVRNYNDTFRDDRFSNVNVKRPLLGTPQNPNLMDSYMINQMLPSSWSNSMPNNQNPQQNPMGNFNHMNRFPINHPQNPKPNFGYPLERRF